MRLENYKSAETWARTNIRGIKYVQYVDGEMPLADMDVIRALNRMAHIVSQRYRVEVPAIAPQAWDGWSSRSDAFMSANGEGIRYNPSECRGAAKVIFVARWEMAPHTSVASKGLDAIVAHEMAHVLGDHGRELNGRPMLPEKGRIFVRNLVASFRSQVGEATIRRELGNYAWFGKGIAEAVVDETAYLETWAQAFSAYTIESSSLSPQTRRLVVDILRRLNLE